jgi:hypothetical protein
LVWIKTLLLLPLVKSSRVSSDAPHQESMQVLHHDPKTPSLGSRV